MTHDDARRPDESGMETEQLESAGSSSIPRATRSRFRQADEDLSEPNDDHSSDEEDEIADAMAGEDHADGDEMEDEFEEIETSRLRSTLRNMSACIVSTIVHLVILIALGLMAAPLPVSKNIREIVSQMFEERPEPLLQEIELDTEIEPAETPKPSLILRLKSA